MPKQHIHLFLCYGDIPFLISEEIVCQRISVLTIYGGHAVCSEFLEYSVMYFPFTHGPLPPPHPLPRVKFFGRLCQQARITWGG